MSNEQKGFNNGGQVPAYGNEKTAQQIIDGLKEDNKRLKEEMRKVAEENQVAFEALKNDNDRLRDAAKRNLNDARENEIGWNKAMIENERLLSRIQQLEQSNVPRWVKAEERLPNKDGWYHIRNTDTHPSTIYLAGSYWLPDKIEWLEELPDKRQSPDK